MADSLGEATGGGWEEGHLGWLVANLVDPEDIPLRTVLSGMGVCSVGCSLREASGYPIICPRCFLKVDL